MSTVGEIEYSVKINTKDFGAQISKVEKDLKKGMGDAGEEAGKEFSKEAAEKADSGGRTFAQKFRDGMTAGLAGKVATDLFDAAKSGLSAMTGIVKDSIANFGDYEQLVGGVETLFKDSAGIVEEYANNAYKTAGLSANQYMETVTSFSASLLQSLGGDTEAAARIGDMAITDMADNANKMGTSMDMIQNAYQGFAKQNYTMLDNLKLGYGGTKTEMERLLKDAEEISGIHYDIDNLSDVYSAIHVIQSELGITGTTAKEASETLQGSAASMKSSWENLLTGMANPEADVGALVGQFVESLGTLLDNLLPILAQAITGLAQMIAELIPQLIAMLPELLQTTLPSIIMAIEGLITSLLEVLPTLIAAFVEIVLAIVDVLLSPDSLTMLLNAAFTLLMAIVEALPQIINALVEALPTLIDSIITFLTDPKTIETLIVASVELFMALVKAIPQILSALFQAFGRLFGSLWDMLKGLFTQFAGNFGNAIASVFKGAVNGVLGFIENIINGPIDIINGFIGLINGAFGFIGVNLGTISRIRLPRMASGGIVPSTMGGQIIMAGEAGEDEWVVPESKMASLVDQINARGAGGNITINVYGTFATSASEQRKVAEQIAVRLQEINRTRMMA